MSRNDAVHDRILLDHLNIALTLSKDTKNELLTYIIEMAILEADPKPSGPDNDVYKNRGTRTCESSKSPFASR